VWTFPPRFPFLQTHNSSLNCDEGLKAMRSLAISLSAICLWFLPSLANAAQLACSSQADPSPSAAFSISITSTGLSSYKVTTSYLFNGNISSPASAPHTLLAPNSNLQDGKTVVLRATREDGTWPSAVILVMADQNAPNPVSCFLYIPPLAVPSLVAGPGAPQPVPPSNVYASESADFFRASSHLFAPVTFSSVASATCTAQFQRINQMLQLFQPPLGIVDLPPLISAPISDSAMKVLDTRAIQNVATQYSDYSFAVSNATSSGCL
jgi:hypothetical protein